ncbi:MAG TPA: hypothetical protein VKA46_36495 [Gemmataceae bacterium]|nr:hypothetical protein [Gemmataceae bacterium]
MASRSRLPYPFPLLSALIPPWETPCASSADRVGPGILDDPR